MDNSLLSVHKKLAMGIAANSGGKEGGGPAIKKFAKGGSVMSESKVTNLPARGGAYPQPKPMAGNAGKVATMKHGGSAVKKSAGRGR